MVGPEAGWHRVGTGAHPFQGQRSSAAGKGLAQRETVMQASKGEKRQASLVEGTA